MWKQPRIARISRMGSWLASDPDALQSGAQFGGPRHGEQALVAPYHCF